MSTISIAPADEPVARRNKASADESCRRVYTYDSDDALSAYIYNIWMAVLTVLPSVERHGTGLFAFIYAYDATQPPTTSWGLYSLAGQSQNSPSTFLYAYVGSQNPNNYAANSGVSCNSTDYDACRYTTSTSDVLVTLTYDRPPPRCNYAETELYYYGYRYYQPEAGRWASRDPLEEEGGLNPLVFVLNNAVNLADFLGLMGTPPATAPAGLGPSCEYNMLIPEVKPPQLNLTKAQMTAKPGYAGTPGLSSHERWAPTLMCCCDAPGSWGMSIWFHISDQMFLADEQYAVYTPSKSAAENHEQCHIDDHQSFFIDVWGQMVAALGGPYATKPACESAKASVNAIYNAKVAEWQARDKHPPERYGLGKPCYAKGKWK